MCETKIGLCMIVIGHNNPFRHDSYLWHVHEEIFVSCIISFLNIFYDSRDTMFQFVIREY